MAAPAALVLAKILIPETKPVEPHKARMVTDAGEATLPSTASDEAHEAV